MQEQVVEMKGGGQAKPLQTQSHPLSSCRILSHHTTLCVPLSLSVHSCLHSLARTEIGAGHFTKDDPSHGENGRDPTTGLPPPPDKPPPPPDKAPPPASFTAFLPHPSLTLSLSLLAFVSGWVDTVSFVGYLGLFAAHITGNFAVIGATVVGLNGTGGSNLARILAIPTFLVSSALTAAFIRAVETYCTLPHTTGRKGTMDKQQEQQNRTRNGHRTTAAAVAVLLAEATMIAVSMVLALQVQPITQDDSGNVLAILGGLSTVCSMGIHGTCGRLLFPHLGPLTNAMTTTSVVLSIDFIDLIRNTRHAVTGTQSMTEKERKEFAELTRRFFRYLSAIVFFVLGSLLSCLTFRGIHWYALLVPIGVLLVFAVIIVAYPAILDRSRG